MSEDAKQNLFLRKKKTTTTLIQEGFLFKPKVLARYYARLQVRVKSSSPNPEEFREI